MLKNMTVAHGFTMPSYVFKIQDGTDIICIASEGTDSTAVAVHYKPSKNKGFK